MLLNQICFDLRMLSLQLAILVNNQVKFLLFGINLMRIVIHFFLKFQILLFLSFDFILKAINDLPWSIVASLELNMITHLSCVLLLQFLVPCVQIMQFFNFFLVVYFTLLKSLYTFYEVLVFLSKLWYLLSVLLKLNIFFTHSIKLNL